MPQHRPLRQEIGDHGGAWQGGRLIRRKAPAMGDHAMEAEPGTGLGDHAEQIQPVALQRAERDENQRTILRRRREHAFIRLAQRPGIAKALRQGLSRKIEAADHLADLCIGRQAILQRPQGRQAPRGGMRGDYHGDGPHQQPGNGIAAAVALPAPFGRIITPAGEGWRHVRLAVDRQRIGHGDERQAEMPGNQAARRFRLIGDDRIGLLITQHRRRLAA